MFALLAPLTALVCLQTPATAPVLTATQVAEKLQAVPVFILTDMSGNPLSAAVEQRQPEILVFFRKQGADEFLKTLQDSNKDLGSRLKVRLLSLAQAQALKEEQKGKQGVRFVPDPAQLMIARDMIKRSGKPTTSFTTPPAFLLRAGEQHGMVMVNQNGKVVLPVFLSYAGVEEMLASFRKTRPELATGIQVEVFTVEQLIQTLKTSPNTDMTKVTVVASKEALAEAKAVK